MLGKVYKSVDESQVAIQATIASRTKGDDKDRQVPVAYEMCLESTSDQL